jgi:adenylyltransferase/sulfurtransferase
MSQVDWDMLNQRRSCSLLARRAANHGGTPTTPVTASVIGAFQAQEVLKALHGLEPLAGRGYFFDGATFDSYPINYPINPDCPWHEDEPCPVESAASLTSDSRLSEVWQFAEQHLGGLDVIEFARELVDSVRCPSCGQETRVLLPADSVTEDQALCRRCGTEGVPAFVHAIPRDSDLLNQRLSDIGIPPWDILWARCRDRYLGVEIVGDCPSALAAGDGPSAAPGDRHNGSFENSTDANRSNAHVAKKTE